MHKLIIAISVGFFVDKDEAVVWRGPMVHRLLQQFLGVKVRVCLRLSDHSVFAPLVVCGVHGFADAVSKGQ